MCGVSSAAGQCLAEAAGTALVQGDRWETSLESHL